MTMVDAYPGGKGACFRNIVNLMPPHETYIETHLGGGSVLAHKRPALRTIGIDIDPAVIERWVSVDWPVLSVVRADAAAYLRGFAFTGRELVYSDPPYLMETRRSQRPLYAYEYTREQHVDLLSVLVELPCAVMVSGYRSSLYTQMLQHRYGWRCVEFTAQTRRGPATECVWLNFDPSTTALHDTKYVGTTFRERERIKRKRKRWRARLERMSPAERQAIIDEVRSLIAENGDGGLPDRLAVCGDAAGAIAGIAIFNESGHACGLAQQERQSRHASGEWEGGADG